MIKFTFQSNKTAIRYAENPARIPDLYPAQKTLIFIQIYPAQNSFLYFFRRCFMTVFKAEKKNTDDRSHDHKRLHSYRKIADIFIMPR